MKTFSTSGTGNQQTLSEIESDKMPIYDSVADAESDLANLEEGQIVATKDTGTELSQPVDTVQSGNLHAVTSNAVAESLSYSTEEMATGGKWIDGKPIYRKTFTGIASNTTGDNVIGNSIISGIDSITMFNGVLDNIVAGGGSVRGMAVPNYYIHLVYDDTNGINLRYNPTDVTSFRHYVIIIEYTKSNN